MKNENQLVFKSKIDASEDQKRTPFLFTGFVAGSFILIYLFDIDLGKFEIIFNYSWYYILGLLLFIELLFLLNRINAYKLKVFKNNDLLKLEIEVAKDKVLFLDIESFDHWWNYDFSLNKKPPIYSNVFNVNGNGLNGKSAETPIIVYLEIHGRDGENILLYEELLPWQDISEGLIFKQTVGNSSYYYRTYKLKKLYKMLKTNKVN